MGKPKFLIITGMSGAGKSCVLRSLEDIGFFCVDNLPPTLIASFIEFCQQMGGQDKSVALVVDIRVGSFFEQLYNILRDFEKQGFIYELLFLDCDDATLIHRYKETRRRHPLAPDGRVSNGLALERELLADVRVISHNIIDTTSMPLVELKRRVTEMFSPGNEAASFNITVVSFGFKFGLPADADMVFDVRFLNNPFYIPELKNKTGNDKEVADYVKNSPGTGEFLQKLVDMMDFLLPQYIQEGKQQLIIGIGCTGGQHRSVFVANELADRLKLQSYKVRKEDRDIGKYTG